jgi:hypothetical protein
MKTNHTFLKLKVINDFLTATSNARANLLNECIGNGGTDPVIRMRRFRMLSQLSQFEAATIIKIYNLDDEHDLDSLVIGLRTLISNVGSVTNKSA